MTMQHDLTHCGSAVCRKRLQCRRYLAHLDRIDRNLKGHYPYITHDEPPKDGCVEFYPLSQDR